MIEAIVSTVQDQLTGTQGTDLRSALEIAIGEEADLWPDCILPDVVKSHRRSSELGESWHWL